VLQPASSSKAAAIRRFIAAVLPSDLSLTDDILEEGQEMRVAVELFAFVRFSR